MRGKCVYCDDRLRYIVSLFFFCSGRCVFSNSCRRSFDVKVFDVFVYFGEYVLYGFEIVVGYVDYVLLDVMVVGVFVVVGEDVYGQFILSEQKRKGQYLKFYGKV